ncbi:MAG: tetratricopeptide repeat protein [Planctomycetes bacterium]|nr:tetratricopeptide repeat protein [Planctomycetota bacterium]
MDVGRFESRLRTEDLSALVRETADWKAGGFKFRLVAECDENAWPQAQPVVENIRARFFALERREFSSEWRPNYDFGFEVEIPPDWEGRTESSDDGRSTRLAMLSPEGKADVTIEVEPAGRPQNIMTLGQARAEEMQGDRARWDGFASKSAGALSMFGVNAYQIEFAYVREGEHRYGKEVLFEFDNLVYHLRFTSAAERAEIHAKSVQVVYDSFALYRNLVSAEAARRSAEAIGRYEEALRFVKARKMEEAAALLEKVTTDAPRFADAWRVMAEVRLSQNRIPEAATLARKARGAYREHPGIRELLAGITLKQADLAFREKRLDDAEKLFAEAAETTHNPKVEETGVTGLCGVGQQYAIAQPPMLTEAAATYQHAVKLAPENVKAKQGLADTYIKVANAAVAKENFSAARSAASKAVAAYKGYKPAQILEDSIDKKEEAARKRREAEAKRRASGK